MFYHLFLRKVKLFRSNRIYLLGSLLASLVIPLLDLQFSFSPEVISQPTVDALTFDTFIPEDFSFTALPDKHFAIVHVFEMIYVAGLLFMLIRLSTYIYKIGNLIRKHQINKIGTLHFVLLDNKVMPFSFFHFIFIEKLKIGETTSENLIIEHEKVHIRELHSLDLILAELVSALLWFNPFTFFYRKSIKENHEYIADSEVIRSGIHPVDYLTTLAKEVFRNHFIGLTSNFNYSITKKRLLMITKINTSKKAGLRFLLILPLLAIMLLAFARPMNTKAKLTTTTLSPGNSGSFNLFSIFPVKTFNLFSTGTITNVPSISPLKDYDLALTSGFGWRIHPLYKIKQFHKAIDMKADEGTPVVATASGTVKRLSGNKNSKGKYESDGMYIVIRHNAQFQTKYTHLSGFAVKAGEHVNIGQTIGYVGNTGFCTGTHLHYEVIKDGVNVDPKDYILSAK